MAPNGLTFALALVLLLATAGLSAAMLVPGRLVAGVLAAWLIAFAEVVCVSFVLSFAGWLTATGMVAALACGLAVAVAVSTRVRLTPPPLRRGVTQTRAALRDPLVAVLAAVATLSLLYTLALGVGTPPNDWDSLIYHLPRAALWAQQGEIGYIPGAPDARLDAMPPNAEIAVLFTMLTSQSDRLAALVQLTALLAGAVAVIGVSRRIGLDARRALFGGLLFACLPVLLLQAGTALNDVVVAALLMATVYFALGTSRAELGLVALGLALAVGTKQTALIALPVLAAVVLALQPARRWLAIGVALGTGLAAGSYWYILNKVETGSFDGGAADALGQVPARSLGDVLLRTYQLSADLLDLPGTLGRGRYTYPLAGALLVIAAVAGMVRLRRWPARVLVLVGCAVAITPLAFDQLAALLPYLAKPVLIAVGRRDLLDQVRSPSVLGEANPFAGYGATAAVLLVAGAVLTVLAVREGLRPGTLVLALAPALFVPLFATAVTYDGIRSRFLAFAIALAASTWGLALGRRTLATGAVALSAVTAFTSLAFATWKPSGLALLLDGHGAFSVWSATEQRILDASVAGTLEDATVGQFVETRVPKHAHIGLAFGSNEALYPFFEQLSRRVTLVQSHAALPRSMTWLVVAPTRQMDVSPLLGTTWHTALATQSGWRVLHRPVPSGGGRDPKRFKSG